MPVRLHSPPLPFVFHRCFYSTMLVSWTWLCFYGPCGRVLRLASLLCKLKLIRWTLVSSRFSVLSGTAGLNPHELGCKQFLLRTLHFVAIDCSSQLPSVLGERSKFQSTSSYLPETQTTRGVMLYTHPGYIQSSNKPLRSVHSSACMPVCVYIFVQPCFNPLT